MRNQVILVDEQDHPIGTMGKLEAHQKGVLHRAYSVFVFNDQGELLLQKRANHKYHSGGLWTNTCCSHPSPGNEMIPDAQLRLQEEMGFTCSIQKSFDFVYKKTVDSDLIEYEYDHVFVGQYNKEPKPNIDEVSDWKYVSMEKIKTDVKQHPSDYTQWFLLCMEQFEYRIMKTLTALK